ncbi:nuclear transcription factor Y subunit gamma [Galendromus occidentalis]|uniref:Nuclear transcription factor Y subunit gamma n=1 Tax=Galendromus occidentalis TaxID=34638 RepID=A0AAJ6QV71_9ACAR|nr:nuclear transcription factor Y subunit gamma [Galendromus occidentalis]
MSSEQNFNQPSNASSNVLHPVMPYENPNHAKDHLETFWVRTVNELLNLNFSDAKPPELPLARIKKIMKLDEDVKMISAEAPILFAKAAELFIMELTLRAWIHTEDNKRRTLQRNDIAMAISKFDMFDFLIDIVPREEQKPPPPTSTSQGTVAKTVAQPAAKEEVIKSAATVNTNDQVQYLLQLAAQQGAINQLQTQQSTLTTAGGQQIQIIPAGGGAPQTIQLATTAHQNFLAPQVVQVQSLDGTQTLVQSGVAGGQVMQIPQVIQQQASATGQQQHIQLVPQVIGDQLQQLPLQAQIGANGQFQLVRVANQTANGHGQPIIIQAAQQASAHSQQQAIYLPNGQQVLLQPGTTIQQALHGEEESTVTVGH